MKRCDRSTINTALGAVLSLTRWLSLLRRVAKVTKPFPVQCFGRYLQVILPPFAQTGLVVQLFLNNGQLSALGSHTWLVIHPECPTEHCREFCPDGFGCHALDRCSAVLNL